MKKSLADLQSAFKTPDRTGGRSNNYYPFFAMPMDASATVRFLPDANEDNPMGFLVEKVMHNLVINGERRSTPCLSMYGEDCPICAVSQQYYKANDEANGKKYWKKRQHIGQVLIIEDSLEADKDTGENHEGKVRFINLGYQLFGIIKTAFEKGHLDTVPYAYEGGCNFEITKSAQGEYSTYALGSSFARKETDLDDDQIAMVEEELVDLSTLLPPNPGIEKTEALLNAALTGDPLEEDSSGGGFAAAVQKTAGKAPTATDDDDDIPVAKTKSAPVVEVADDDSVELLDDEEDILKRIRSRRKSKTAE